MNGFLPSSSDQHSCGDIDECADATHICHANAICINQPGGYSCQCAVDFHGNGFDCQERQVSVDPATQQSVLEQPSSHGDVVLLDHNAIETEPDSDAGQTSDASAPSAVPLLCQHCASHADCVEGTCVCQPGFFGDGVTCSSTCDEYSVWSNDRCVPVDANAASTEELDDNGEDQILWQTFGDINCGSARNRGATVLPYAGMQLSDRLRAGRDGRTEDMPQDERGLGRSEGGR